MIQRNEAELRQLICRIGELMHRQHYIDGAAGNISARLDEDHILVTPSGVAKGFLTPEQLIVLDMQGRRVDAPSAANAHLRPTVETSMHLACYQTRGEIGGVVHAHPIHATALSMTGYDFNRYLLPEMMVALGVVASLPYATPSDATGTARLRDAVRTRDVVMLSFHGSLTVAADVWDAYLRLESLEHVAQMGVLVEQLGGVKGGIARDQFEALMAIRVRLGRARPDERAIYEQAENLLP